MPSEKKKEEQRKSRRRTPSSGKKGLDSSKTVQEEYDLIEQGTQLTISNARFVGVFVRGGGCT